MQRSWSTGMLLARASRLGLSLMISAMCFFQGSLQIRNVREGAGEIKQQSIDASRVNWFQYVTYELEGNYEGSGHVEYRNRDGKWMVVSLVGLPWSVTKSMPSSVNASMAGEMEVSSLLTCRIKINGNVVAEHTVVTKSGMGTCRVRVSKARTTYLI